MPIPGQNTPNTIVLTQPKRFGIDISDFTTAIRAAENIDYPTRYKLFDLYEDILIDSHLTSVMEKRVESVLSADLAFRRNGKPDDSINEQLRSPWFIECLQDILEAKFWGFSLLQFYKEGEWINYDLIPRKHVDPGKKMILRRQTDLKGISWNEYSNLLYVGNRNKLGLLARAVPWVIYKRNDVADWAQFAEVFGAPIREYVYDSDDTEARQRAVADAKDSGGMSVFIHAKDTELHLKESGNKSGTSDLYDKLCERCNAEISKIFLGNTLTTEAGAKGTQALGTVHKKGEEKIIKSDRRFLLNVLNYNMADIFLAMGIDTKGGEFYYPDPKDVDLGAKMNILTQAKRNFNLPIDDDYLYDEFGIDKPKDYDRIKKEQKSQNINPTNDSKKKKGKGEEDDIPPSDPKPESHEAEEKKNLASWLKSFFVHASQDGEAPLKW